MTTIYQIMKQKKTRKIIWFSEKLGMKILSNGFFAIIETPKLKTLNLAVGEMYGDFIWSNEREATYQPCKATLTGFSDTLRFEIPDSLHCEHVNKEWHDAIVKELGGECQFFMDTKLRYSPIFYKIDGHLLAALQPKRD